MTRASFAFSLALLTPFFLHAQGRGGAAQAPARIPPIEERTAGMQKIDGYFPLYWDERTGSLFLEIPRFDTDFLYATASPPDSAPTTSASTAVRKAAAKSSRSSASDRAC